MPPVVPRRNPTRASLGAASLRISNLLVFSSDAKLDSPVTLPPGRARLETKPARTGSPAFVITMGMFVVAFLAADVAGVPEVTIRSTLSRTKSDASSGKRSSFSLCESILDGDVLSFNPAKLAQLLPERVQADRDIGSSAIIEEPDAENFSRLLRLGGRAQRKDYRAEYKDGDFIFHAIRG